MAVVHYTHPVTGDVAPTGAQAHDMVTGVIDALAASSTVEFVHNMGLTAAQIAAGNPIVGVTPYGTAEAREAKWYVSGQTANGATLQGMSATASTATAVVTVRRPHTIGN